jgi:hypothetical protein
VQVNSNVSHRMESPVPHPSDSSAQKTAEAAVLSALEACLGFPVKGARVALGDGCFVNVDGINQEKRFACEVFSRIGKLQAAQVEKVASDVLKLSLLEAVLGGAWRKAICFVDEGAANVLRNRSWLARAAQHASVEVFVLRLPGELHQLVLAAQARQIMVNKVLDA